MTPGCTFETALAVLYLVHMTQNVFLYSMGGDTCVWACHLLPIQHPPPLLTCFLSLLLFTSCCLMEASRAKQKFSCRSQEPQAYICVSLALFLRKDAWAFWPLFSGGSESPASSPHVPLGSQMFQKVDVTGSLITNYLANTVYENPIPLAAQL